MTIANKDFVLGNITLSPFVYSFDAQFSLIAMGISFKNAEGKTSTVSTNMAITSELQEKPAMNNPAFYTGMTFMKSQIADGMVQIDDPFYIDSNIKGIALICRTQTKWFLTASEVLSNKKN